MNTPIRPSIVLEEGEGRGECSRGQSITVSLSLSSWDVILLLSSPLLTMHHLDVGGERRRRENLLFSHSKWRPFPFSCVVPIKNTRTEFKLVKISGRSEIVVPTLVRIDDTQCDPELFFKYDTRQYLANTTDYRWSMFTLSLLLP